MVYNCFIIGVCGGSGSGKTTFAKLLIDEFETAGFISQDSYYHDQSSLTDEQVKEFNFDHPDSIELNRLCQDLTTYKQGNDIDVPKYCFKSHSRLKDKEVIEFQEVAIVEGIHIFSTQELRNVFDLKVFLDLDSDMRFLRRLKRDVIERGRTVESIIDQYEATTRPMYKEYVESVKKYCDLVLDTESEADYRSHIEAVKANTKK